MPHLVCSYFACDASQNEIVIGGASVVRPHCYAGGLVEWRAVIILRVVLLRER